MWILWDIPSLRNISNTFLTIFLLITFNILCCWRVSRDTFNGRSSLSTIYIQRITSKYFWISWNSTVDESYRHP